jgi:hypothetical protein
MAYKNEELLLRNAILEIAPEKDPLTLEKLRIKTLLRERGASLNTKITRVLKTLKHPWELLAPPKEDELSASQKWAQKFIAATFTPSIEKKILENTDSFFDPIAIILKQLNTLQTELSTDHKNNPTLRQSLQNISTFYRTFIETLCQLPPDQRKIQLQGKVQLAAAEIGTHFLTPQAAYALTQDKANTFGSHKVVHLNGVHYKENPYAPGIEKAVDTLNKLVSSQGSPPTLLLKIHHPTLTSPFIASKTVQGENLQDILWNAPQKITQIHPTNFSATIILGILVDPIDGKPDNFMLAPSRYNPQNLDIICFDSDMSFSNAIVQCKDIFAQKDAAYKHMIDVKYIPFCFPQMNQKIDPTFRDTFLKLCPEEIIIEWLYAIIKQNTDYKTLRTQKIFTEQEYEKLQLPIALTPPLPDQPGLVHTLYTKLQTLQTHLKTNPQATHWDLFKKAHPILARYYQEILQDYQKTIPQDKQTLYGSFLHIYRKDSPWIEETVNLQSTINSRLTVKSALRKHKTGVGRETENRISSPKKTLQTFIANIPWKTLTPQNQNRLIQQLFTLPFLKDHTFIEAPLTDAHLSRLAQTTPEFRHITLKNCPHITQAGLSALITKHPTLHLNIEDCPHIKRQQYYLLTQSTPHFTLTLSTKDKITFTPKNKTLLLQILHARDEEALFAALSLENIPINHPDAQGTTPLHLAVRSYPKDPTKGQKIITALFFAGADPTLKDSEQETPLQKGERKNIPQAVEQLKRLADPEKLLEEGEKLKGEFVNEKNFEIWKKERNSLFFGKAKWAEYFGDVGETPPLPANINEILKSSCPFWPDKKVYETHLLVLIPEKVNGKPFCLDSLGELIKSPKSGHKTEYKYYWDEIKKDLGTKSLKSHWVLMTRNVIPESRNKSYEVQKALVQEHAQRSNIPYELPKALEAATAILMHHVETGERLYPDDPCTYTRCQKKVNNNQWPAAIGGFAAGGLVISNRWGGNEVNGVAGALQVPH